MLALVPLGSELERIMGSIRLLYMIVLLATSNAIFHLLIAFLVAYNPFHPEPYLVNECAIGFSGILFSMIVIETSLSGVQSRRLVFTSSCNKLYFPTWLLLFFSCLLILQHLLIFLQPWIIRCVCVYLWMHVYTHMYAYECGNPSTSYIYHWINIVMHFYAFGQCTSTDCHTYAWGNSSVLIFFSSKHWNPFLMFDHVLQLMCNFFPFFAVCLVSLTFQLSGKCCNYFDDLYVWLCFLFYSFAFTRRCGIFNWNTFFRYAFILLVVFQLLMTNVSLLGHLCGILSGFACM